MLVLQGSMNYATRWGTESNVSNASASAILGGALAAKKALNAGLFLADFVGKIKCFDNGLVD